MGRPVLIAGIDRSVYWLVAGFQSLKNTAADWYPEVFHTGKLHNSGYIYADILVAVMIELEEKQF